MCSRPSRHLLDWIQCSEELVQGGNTSVSTFGFPCGSDGKESACSVGDLGSIPGSGQSPGKGNGCPLQYSGLENSIDRGAWQATVHGLAKSQTQLSYFHFWSLMRSQHWTLVLRTWSLNP